jgi:hypothetical protein
MHKYDLIRYHTVDGSFRDLKRSDTGILVYYPIVKEAVLHYLQGISRMIEVPGSLTEAMQHNECIDNLFALFKDKDPIDDEIVEIEKKLAELKQRKNENLTKNPYGYSP